MVAAAGAGRCRSPRRSSPPVRQRHTGASSKASTKARSASLPNRRRRTRGNDITTYNNYYEFGTDKDSPSLNARQAARPSRGRSRSKASARKKGNYPLDDILKGQTLEERIYRHRCVEAWSMVIPWVGFPLSDLIKKCRADGEGEVRRVHDAGRSRTDAGPAPAGARWPYVEGLRMDEAMHPLTILAVGLYGEVLPNQNGAPLRLVVPWKYGFKGTKSIVRIRFVGTAAAEHLAGVGAARVRVLRERESERRSSALEPGQRAAHRRVLQAQDADVQRLRRSGRRALRRHGSEEELLSGPERPRWH